MSSPLMHYEDMKYEAMLDLVSDPRAVVYVADAALDWLKRCGSCEHFYIAGYEGDETCDQWVYADKEGPAFGDVRHADHCHYDPPRWKECS